MGQAQTLREVVLSLSRPQPTQNGPADVIQHLASGFHHTAVFLSVHQRQHSRDQRQLRLRYVLPLSHVALM